MVLEKTAVIIVPVSRRKVLLVRKQEEPGAALSKRIALVVETAEEGEIPEQTARRGMREETSLEITELYFLASSRSSGFTPLTWFACIPINPQSAKPGSDATEVRWYKPTDVLSIYGNLLLHPLPDEVRRFLKAV